MTAIERARAGYQKRSETASTIARHLCFAGIALIWVFKTGPEDGSVIERGLVWPAGLIILALALDLFQYTWASLWLGWFYRHHEKKVKAGAEEPRGWPRWFNCPSLACFWGKIVLVFIAYVLMLVFLAGRVLPSSAAAESETTAPDPAISESLDP